MGKVGRVGDWRDFCESVPIGCCRYHYDTATGVWFNNDGETDFYITFDLDLGRVQFVAQANRFYRDFRALSNSECTDIEDQVKRKYGLNGRVRFFRP